jgi:hypothetical protein
MASTSQARPEGGSVRVVLRLYAIQMLVLSSSINYTASKIKLLSEKIFTDKIGRNYASNTKAKTGQTLWFIWRPSAKHMVRSRV